MPLRELTVLLTSDSTAASDVAIPSTDTIPRSLVVAVSTSADGCVCCLLTPKFSPVRSCVIPLAKSLTSVCFTPHSSLCCTYCCSVCSAAPNVCVRSTVHCRAAAHVSSRYFICEVSTFASSVST